MKKETILVIVVWALVYAAAPLLMLYSQLASHQDYDWRGVFFAWTNISIFSRFFY